MFVSQLRKGFRGVGVLALKGVATRTGGEHVGGP